MEFAMLFCRPNAAVMIGLLALVLSSCMKMASKPSGNSEGIHGAVARIEDIDHVGVRCTFYEKVDGIYQLFCRAMVVEADGGLTVAQDVVETINLRWNEPTVESGAPLSSKRCENPDQNLFLLCDLSFATDEASSLAVSLVSTDNVEVRSRTEETSAVRASKEVPPASPPAGGGGVVVNPSDIDNASAGSLCTQTISFAGGAGTVGSPYLIATAQQMNWVRCLRSKAFRLQNDIPLSAITFLPIGSSATPFTGNFDGAGHRLTDWTFNASTSSLGRTDRIGIFGELNGATVSNLDVKNATVTGGTRVGLMAGAALDSTITKCSSSGSVLATGYDAIYQTTMAGGLIGISEHGSLSRCLSSADVTITGSSGSSAGGLLGEARYGSIHDAYATGDVTSPDAAGGFVGIVHYWTPLIANCYSTGTASGATRAGGFSATYYDVIDSYGNFWDKDTSSQSAASSIAQGKTTAQMKTQGTFTNWDFVNVWIMNPGEYPTLR